MTHPARLGKYRIEAVLGEGAMGVVYRGHDPDIRRAVAIKTIRRELTDGSSHAAMIAARFRNEAQAAGRLSHPGIVAVHDYGEDGEVAYIAMEYVEGRSIARHLAEGRRFTDAEIPRLMDELLDALDHAHAHGVWHRDIKPANVILTDRERLKIADFGTARMEDTELTQAGTVIGTPAYMAPEQFLGTAIDARVDLYGAGVLLYVMLTGRPPFAGASTEALLYQVVHQPPRPPSQVDGVQRPQGYDAVVARALAKDPRDRYAGADDFRRALRAAVAVPRDPAAIAVGDDEATIVVPVRRPDAAAAAEAERSAVEPRLATGTGASTAGFDAATLAHAESTLSRYVGPMASLLVRRAARDCDTATALYARLAGEIVDDGARRDFLARAGPPSSTVSAAAPCAGADTASWTRRPGTAATAVTSPGAATAAPPLDDALLARTRALLARHVGPIAGVLVKQAAAATNDRGAFIARAAAAIADPAERSRLIAELERRP